MSAEFDEKLDQLIVSLEITQKGYEALMIQNVLLRNALLRIAFDEDVDNLAGNPAKWPSTIAYDALGGRFKDGGRLDNRADLAAD